MMVLKVCIECGESKKSSIVLPDQKPKVVMVVKVFVKSVNHSVCQTIRTVGTETIRDKSSIFSEEVDTVSKLTQWEQDGYQSIWVDMTIDRVVKYFLDTQCKKEDSLCHSLKAERVVGRLEVRLEVGWE